MIGRIERFSGSKNLKQLYYNFFSQDKKWHDVQVMINGKASGLPVTTQCHTEHARLLSPRYLPICNIMVPPHTESAKESLKKASNTSI